MNSKILSSINKVLPLVLMVLCVALASSAQKLAGKNSTPVEQSKTRARATAQTSPTPPATQPSPETPKVEAAKEESQPEVSKAEPSPAVDPQPANAGEERPRPVKVDPGPTPADRLRQQLKLVEQMIAAGQKQEALAELQTLSAEDRFDPQGFYNIGNALARLDATDAAIGAYRKAIEQRTGRYSRASNNLGVVLLRQGFWDQAYDAFMTALRVENFHYAEASYNLGRLFAARGETERAIREWRRALFVDPRHDAAARALGNVGSSSSSNPAAVSYSPPASREPTRSTRQSSPQPNTTKAVAAPRPFTLDAETHEVLQQGRTAHERGRYEEAVTNFRRVISKMGGYFSPANLELGFALIELRRNDEAIAALLQVTERDGARFPISYYHLGRLYELRGDLKEAEVNYLRATQAYQTENPQFLLDLSKVREKRGDFTGALVAMENYIKRKDAQGQKPDWSDTRLAELRAKAAGSQNPKQ